MYVIKGEPRLSAKGHEVFAEMHAESACNLRRAATEQPESPDALELLALAARQEGASKGHSFRALELGYDARGGMTEAQAIKRELANFVRAATDAGMPVLVWSPEASEAQGETWDESRKGDG